MANYFFVYNCLRNKYLVLVGPVLEPMHCLHREGNDMLPGVVISPLY